MRIIITTILILMGACSFPMAATANIHDWEGKWIVSGYIEMPIYALTRDQAEKIYGRALILYRNWIAFGSESIKNPIFKRIPIKNESEFREQVGVSPADLDGPIDAFAVYEVYDSSGKAWRHPGGLLVVRHGTIYTHWDGLIFVFKRS